MLTYMMLLSFAIISIGLAGITATRHFIMIVVSVELMLLGSSLLAVSIFHYYAAGNIIILLLSIWAVAAIEVIVAVVLYRYMEKEELTLDVSKFSKLRD
ncbi:MAG: NADH-quinone oxidoreductase subunit NuoK [Candidatus Micrarchaeia archaeon]